jgi:hypothetical protein
MFRNYMIGQSPRSATAKQPGQSPGTGQDRVGGFSTNGKSIGSRMRPQYLRPKNG